MAKDYSDFGIEIPYGRKSGHIKVFCPKCRDQRSNKRDRSLSVDLDKGDAEMKLMVGCTEEEKAYIERFYNEWPDMGAKIIKRSLSQPLYYSILSICFL